MDVVRPNYNSQAASKRVRKLWRQIVVRTPHVHEDDHEELARMLDIEALQSYYARGSTTGNITVQDVNNGWRVVRPVVRRTERRAWIMLGRPAMEA